MDLSRTPALTARPLIRVVVAVLFATLATAGLSALGAPAQAKGSSTRILSMSSDTYEHKVRFFINKKRAQHNLPRLRVESCTDGSAERWAKKLAASDTFYHQDMGRLLDRCSAYYAGETLGKGGISPHRLVSLWMHSPAHKHVLLSRHAKRIGVGAYLDPTGAWVTAANFTKF